MRVGHAPHRPPGLPSTPRAGDGWERPLIKQGGQRAEYVWETPPGQGDRDSVSEQRLTPRGLAVPLLHMAVAGRVAVHRHQDDVRVVEHFRPSSEVSEGRARGASTGYSEQQRPRGVGWTGRPSGPPPARSGPHAGSPRG
ncbi:hypothetical protein C4L39_26265 [Clostridium diolis]|nr:hypothetical protein C4L39_26265 [Clostridium diolis]